jgi:hypothetical protein
MKVLQQHNEPAKMAGAPSLWASLGEVWRGAIVVLLVGTSIAHFVLRESSCAGSHVGRSGQWEYRGRGGVSFDHEILPRHLWLPHPAFMVTACRDHVEGWAVWRAPDHFSNKIHLPGRDHCADAGNGVEHVAHLALA